MNPNFDFEPAAIALESVVTAISDDQFAATTPAGEHSVRSLLIHVIGLTEAFRQAATKESVGSSVAPTVEADAELPADWQSRIGSQLKALVAAWREPAAWDGETEAGGVRAPAPVMAMVALDELVVHGWDLARATGQPFTVDPGHTTVLLEFLRDTPPAGTPGLFGPVVPVPETAPAVDRLMGLTGRDPAWAR